MLRLMQIGVLLFVGISVMCFSVWRYHLGGTWWIAAGASLLAYIGIVSLVNYGSSDAWYAKAYQIVLDLALSNNIRAGVSLLLMVGLTAYLGKQAYQSPPPDSDYYEVRVYENADLPGNYQVGAKVVIHSKTGASNENGRDTDDELVGDDGAAIFQSLSIPTTLNYQVEIYRATPPFMVGGNDTVRELPQLLEVDVAAVPLEQRFPITDYLLHLGESVVARPVNYLLNVDQRGDTSLQGANAPWGVPSADLVVNRLGYTPGFDLNRKLARWVAYSIAPTDERIPRPDRFVQDPAIPERFQASTSDYRGSGYDRGHLISPADLFFKGPVTVAEAFYMSTVTPQTRWLNRRMWRDVEVRVRNRIEARQQAAFVMAGPLFIESPDHLDGTLGTIGENEIPIPTHFFRVMTMPLPTGGIESFAVIVPNLSEGPTEVSNYVRTISDVERYSGLKLLPLLDENLAAEIKSTIYQAW